MKKVIATTAGLLLVGAMASSAMAEIQFGGDARARFYTRDNYDMNSDNEDDNEKIESRVRLEMEGTYDKSFAKARVKIGDGTWDGGDQTGAAVKSDYAYVGTTVGIATVSAGRQITNFGNKFWSWDGRQDRLKVACTFDSATVAAIYDKMLEFTDDETSEMHDEDTNRYGVAWKQTWGAGWGTDLIAMYKDNEANDDLSGWTGSFAFSGPLGPVTLVGEFSYKDSNYLGKVDDIDDDDGIGGFAGLVIKPGDLTIILPVAFTQGGYVADGDFQPTYLFGTENNPIGIISFGQLGDTWAVAPSVDYKVSDLLTIHGGVAYADIDEALSIVEIDAGLIFTLSEQSWFHLKAGHGIPDLDDETASSDSITGVMAELGLKF